MQEKEVTFYVSIEGNDMWSGRYPEPNKGKTDGPFATIQAAKKTIRRRIDQTQTDRRERKFLDRSWAIKIVLRGGGIFS